MYVLGEISNIPFVAFFHVFRQSHKYLWILATDEQLWPLAPVNTWSPRILVWTLIR